MNIQSIHHLFANTLHSDLQTRQVAENQLTQLDSSPDSMTMVLQLIDHNETAPPVKLASAIYLKNRIRKAWELNEFSPSELVQVSETDKVAIKANILAVMSRSPENIRAILTPSINSILICDYPNKWPEFVPSIQAMIQSSDQSLVHCGLLSLLELYKIYCWKTIKEGITLEQLVDGTFPQILTICSNMVQQDSNEASIMMKLGLKIYNKGLKSVLPKSQQEPGTLIAWGNIFIQVAEKAVPLSALTEDVDERNQLGWVKARKWGFNCLNSLFERYGNPVNLSSKSKYIKFAQQFVKHFAPNILKVYLEQLFAYADGQQWMSTKCLVRISEFLGEAIRAKATWAQLNPNVEMIITKFIFPNIGYSEDDVEALEDNPAEFLMMRLSHHREGLTVADAADGLLNNLVANKKKYVLDGMMQLVTSVLVRNANSPSHPKIDREKDCALAMVESIAGELSASNKKTRMSTEQFIVDFALPELAHPNPLLRYRAASLMYYLSGMRLSSEEVAIKAFTAIYPCLNDSQLIVSVASALALEGLFEYDQVRLLALPLLPNILEQLLNLSNQVDIEQLSQVLESLVECFSEQLAPYAAQLTQSLTQTSLRILEEIRVARGDQDEFSEENPDKIYAVSGLIKTISTLMVSLDEKPEILDSLEPIFLPMLHYVFRYQLDEIYDEVYEVIDAFLYASKKVSPNMWSLFDLIYETFSQGNMFYLGELFGTFDNYLTYGLQHIAGNQLLQEKFFNMFSGVLKDEDYESNEKVMAIKVMIGLLLQLQSHGIPIIKPTLYAIFPYLSNYNELVSKGLKIYTIKLVVVCLATDLGMTIQTMEENGWTQAFFTLWFQNFKEFFGVHDKKLCITAVCRILATPYNSLPLTLQAGWAQYLPALATFFNGLPEAEKKRDLALKQFGEDEDETPSLRTNGDDLEDDDNSDLEEQELEQLQELASQAHSTNHSDDSDTDSDGESYYSDEDILEVDPSRSPLDHLDVYIAVADVIATCQADQPSYHMLASSLTQEDKIIIDKVVAEGNIRRSK